MNAKSKRNFRVIALSVVLCLSLASYLTLRVLESDSIHEVPTELMAEEVESGNTLPDVQLLKKLMHRTMEFMLSTPKF